jgi:hypothetical protein
MLLFSMKHPLLPNVKTFFNWFNLAAIKSCSVHILQKIGASNPIILAPTVVRLKGSKPTRIAAQDPKGDVTSVRK